MLGTPHNPKPPTAREDPGTTSATASRALATTLSTTLTVDPRGRRQRLENRVSEPVDLIELGDRWVEIQLGKAGVLKRFHRVSHLGDGSKRAVRDHRPIVAEEAVVVEEVLPRRLLGILAE